jgi:hypothetical protein
MFRRFMHVAGIVALSLAPGMSARLEQRSPPNGGQAIVGRVTDAAGAAVGGVFVSVLRDEEARRGAPRLHPVDVRFHSVTNQNGEFRLQNLLPDSYAVVALPRNVPLDAQNRPNRTGYGITYYPNATNAGDAKSVMVTAAPAPPRTSRLLLRASASYRVWSSAPTVRSPPTPGSSSGTATDCSVSAGWLPLSGPTAPSRLQGCRPARTPCTCGKACGHRRATSSPGSPSRKSRSSIAT